MNVWFLLVWDMLFKFNIGEKGSAFVMGLPEGLMEFLALLVNI